MHFEDHVRETGSPPNYSTGMVWRNYDSWLKKNYESSLAALSESLGYRSQSIMPKVVRFARTNKRGPRVSDGPMWAAIEKALRVHGSSLRALRSSVGLR